MKNAREALQHLLLFKPYTIYGRWFEVGCGVIAWLNIFILLTILLKYIL